MKFKILALLMFSFPFLGVFLGSGCSKPITPVIPSIPVATNTPTMTITATMTFTPHASPTFISTPPMGIVLLAEVQGGTGSVWASLTLSVNQKAETAAGVTITTPSGSFPMTNNNVYAGWASFTNYGSGWSYQPGGSYTVTAVTSIGTATATLVAPGGNVKLSPDGLTASWQYEGNEDWLYIESPTYAWYQTNNYTIDIDSPYSIPATVYSGPGTYTGMIYPQSSTYNITGASSNSWYEIECVQPVTVVK